MQYFAKFQMHTLQLAIQAVISEGYKLANVHVAFIVCKHYECCTSWYSNMWFNMHTDSKL